MSCCSQKRRQLNAQSNLPHEAARPVSRHESLRSPERLPGQLLAMSTLEYTGSNELSVIGPTTGAHYRFTQTATRLAIDSRDVPALLGLRWLRQAN
jgi:hypothetical protein